VTPLENALARLETRWGSAAVRVGRMAEQRPHGALVLVPEAAESEPRPIARPAATDGLTSGLPALDALLGPMGLPRAAAASLRGAGSSGKTTLALHWLARAQAQGAIAAYLDLGRSFDPLEAASRGVDLRWLLVLRPADADEGFALAAALLGGRAIELLVVDLPDRLPARLDASLRRLAAHAHRVGARLIILEPTRLAGRLHGALAEAVGLRLELEQHGWLRLGRDIVGRRIGVSVAKSRFGPPGRRAEVEVHYLPEGELGPPITALPEARARAAPAA
jgi:recombination protein RecA